MTVSMRSLRMAVWTPEYGAEYPLSAWEGMGTALSYTPRRNKTTCCSCQLSTASSIPAHPALQNARFSYDESGRLQGGVREIMGRHKA